MKVLLINPPWILKKDERDFFRVSQPDGLGYIAAVLEQHGHVVHLLDAAATGWKTYEEKKGNIIFGMSYKDINTFIESYQPDLIGVTIYSTLLKENGFQLIKQIRKHHKQVKIAVGGAHPCVAKEECMADKNIDFVIFGEGEITFLELVNELQNPEPKLDIIRGLGYREGKHTKFNAPRETIADLDTLPFPARHFYPMEDYYQASRKLLSSFALSTYNKRWATMVTSRGCPYSCVFCSIHLSMGRKFRPRSPENVVREIEELLNKYHVSYIAFLDDNMSLDRKRMHAICDLILEKNLKFEWSTPNGLRADSLDEDLLTKMKKTGCTRIAVAAESGSQRVVKEVVKKNLDLSHIPRVVKICKKIRLKVDVFFVLGLLGEKKEEMQMTLDFAKELKKLGASGFNIAVATPFKGTELYHQMKKEGYINDDFDALTMFRENHYIGTKDFTAEDLAEFSRKGKKLIFFPTAYTKFIALLLLRDPKRFFYLLKSKLKSMG